MFDHQNSKYTIACKRLHKIIQNNVFSLKLLLRRFNRLALYNQVIVILSVCVCSVMFLMLLLPNVYNITKSKSFLESHKCPACFGFKACDKLKNGEITLTGVSGIFGFFDNSMDKYFGKTKGGTEVILSKLGNKNQITEWEELICSKAKKSRGCDVSSAAQNIFPLSGSKWIQSSIKNMSLMTKCPSERMVGSMQFRYMETLDDLDMSAKERIQMVLTLWRSQEPMIYQMFTKRDGWPFPEYLGSCGRIMVYESPGKPLSTILDKPWIDRARLAIKILKIAKIFTHNLSKYGIYMFRVGFDTFHVKSDTNEVFYTNPEDLLVVDRWQIEQDKNQDWDFSLRRDFTECRIANPQLSLDCQHAENWNDIDNLCLSHYSDHNFYAVCRNIFAPVTIIDDASRTENVGLLRAIPTDIDKLYGIQSLIDTCANTPPKVDREEAAARLLYSLEQIVDNSMDE